MTIADDAAEDQVSSDADIDSARSLGPEIEDPVIDVVAERKQAKRERRRLLWSSPAFVFGMIVIVFWVFCALFPDLVSRYDPLAAVEGDSGRLRQVSPTGDAWFGTDQLARDVFSRTLAGARAVLTIAPVAALLATAAGTMLGLIMGYYRGWVDEILGRIIEGILSIPVILLALLAATMLGDSRLVVTLIIATLFTPIVTRTIRASVISEAQLDYVTSAKLRGEGGLFIMVREILPNISGTIVVELTVRIGYAIFTVATLSFLGLTAGGDVTTPNWGTDINQTFGLIQDDVWWPTLFPALAIASLVIAVNLVADTLERVNKA